MQQAKCAHSGADTGTSSGNDEISSVPSRRALLGFAGIGAIALAAPIAAAAPPVASISPAMRAAVDAYVAAAARSDAFDTTVYEPKWKAYRRQAEAVPHTVVDINRMAGVIATWTTADPGHVDHCRRLVAIHRQQLIDDGRSPDLARGTAHDLVAAADAREAVLSRLRAETGVDVASDRSDELGEEAYQAACAVINLPASSAADMMAKIEHIEARGFETDGWVWEAFVDDVRRLNVQAGSCC